MQRVCSSVSLHGQKTSRRKGWPPWQRQELRPSCPVVGGAGVGLSGCQHPESSPGDPPRPHHRLPALRRCSPCALTPPELHNVPQMPLPFPKLSSQSTCLPPPRRTTRVHKEPGHGETTVSPLVSILQTGGLHTQPWKGPLWGVVAPTDSHSGWRGTAGMLGCEMPPYQGGWAVGEPQPGLPRAVIAHGPLTEACLLPQRRD